MAVFARSGDQARTSRRGVWMFAVAPLAVIAFAIGAAWVAAAARDTDRAPVSGELRVGDGGLEVTQPALGREVDRVGTVAALLSADSLGDREVTLRVRTSYPAVDAAGFDAAYARAAAVVTPVSVHVEDPTFTENSTYLSTLLAIDRVAAKP